MIMIGNTDCDVVDSSDAERQSARRSAPAAIASIGAREPNPPMTTLPASAPTTPPRLNAVMPHIAVAASNPALVSNAVSQLKPRYTARRGAKNAPNNASVSKRQSGRNQRSDRGAFRRLCSNFSEERRALRGRECPSAPARGPVRTTPFRVARQKARRLREQPLSGPGSLAPESRRRSRTAIAIPSAAGPGCRAGRRWWRRVARTRW